jgi:ADP-heptose:LPS heptosyltransferase
MHKVVTQLLAHTSFRIVLAGGPDARDLEAVILHTVIEYHGTKERVDSVVGDKTMSQVMALAQKAALVIGPETGILNAVSMEDVPKVCLLSHSAPSNLTDDWKNAVALIPQVPCHPCHRLHHKEAGTCPIDKETGAAACAAAVPPADYIQAILAILEHANQSFAA